MRDGKARPARPAQRSLQRTLLASTMLLANCAMMAEDTVRDVGSLSAPQGEQSVVLARFMRDGRPAYPGTLWDMQTGRRVLHRDGAWRPGPGDHQGWVQAHLAPGQYFLQSNGSRGAIFRVRSPRVVHYVGSFEDACVAPRNDLSCRPGNDAGNELGALCALLGNCADPLARPTVALARPYPPSLSELRLPPPTALEVTIERDPSLAVNGQTGTQDPRAEKHPLEVPVRHSRNLDGIIGAGILAPVIVVIGGLAVAMLPVLAAEEIARRTRSRAEERGAQVEAERLQQCARALNEALGPNGAEMRLRTAMADSAPRRTRAAPAVAWYVAVTHVQFRRCGTGHYGLEVATRWTATRRGASEAAFEAFYRRQVANAEADGRFRSDPLPWELPVTLDAPCRPLAMYCGIEGAHRFTRDLIESVTGARDAVAAGQ